jgi:hypothetical protein
MSNDNAHPWKKFLLKSGVPLEIATYNTFLNNEITSSGEYYYPRMNDKQQEVTRSIDFLFEYSIPLDGYKDMLHVSIPVECKYKNPNSRWIFMQEFSDNNQHFGDRYNKIIVLEEIFKEKLLNGIKNNDIAEAKSCIKGTEFFEDKKPTDEFIINAISQIEYSIPNIISDSLASFQIPYYFSSPMNEKHRKIIIPTIITTAELYIYKKDLNLKKIEDSTKIDEIADPEKFLLLQKSNSHDLISYANNVYKQLEQMELVNNNIYKSCFYHFPQNDPKFSPLDKYNLSYMSQIYPSFIYIVNFQYLDSFIKKIKKNIKLFLDKKRR